MSASPAASSRRLLALVCAAPLVLGLAACGRTTHPASAQNNGVYVDGGPITYQLEISRELNQYSTEDSQYIRGLGAGTSTTLAPSQIWYGVFLWAKNQTRQAHDTAPPTNIDIVDTQGNHYYPVAISSSANPYAWTSMRLGPNSIEPAPDTTASFGPTQGGLLLFKLNTSVYDNRPLTLEIRPVGGGKIAAISLDL